MLPPMLLCIRLCSFYKEELRRQSEYRSMVSYTPCLTSTRRTFSFCRGTTQQDVFKTRRDLKNKSSNCLHLTDEETEALRNWCTHGGGHHQSWTQLFIIPYNEYRVLYSECIFSKIYFFYEYGWFACMHVCAACACGV